jgi:PAS domain S-box-containing protein
MDISVGSAAPNPRLKTFTQIVALIAMLVGAVVLMGWFLNVATLKVLLPGLASMKANTATCLALCGLSLWLLGVVGSSQAPRQNRSAIAARFVATVPLFVGLATLAEYLFRRNLGIDQLLLADRLGRDQLTPGRMAPHTALCFVALGLALALNHVETKRGVRPSQFLCLAPALISLMAMMGYLCSVVSFYRIASYTGMALHTAATTFLLSLGVFFSVSDRGLAAIFSSETLGAIVLRRLLPAAFLVPIVIGWFRMEGQKAGWYGTEFGLALMVSINVTIFSVVIYLSSKEIDRISIARQETERALRTSQDGLLAMNYTFESVIDACPFSIITLDRQARVQVWNRAAEKMLGWSWLQIRGRAIPIERGNSNAELGSILESLTGGDSVDGVQIVLLSSDDRAVTVTVWAAPIVVGSRGFSGAVLILQNDSPAGQFPNHIETVHS